jgi:hypothetical protein
MSLCTHVSLAFDFFCGPRYDRWRADLRRARDGLAEDLAFVVRHRTIARRKPSKGIVRLALACGWAAVHVYALFVFTLYGSFAAGPLIATWWCWSTAFAGGAYVLLMYSDPGFVEKEVLKRLAERAGLGIDVVGSDVGRGLLQDVAGDVPDMSMLPVPPPRDEGGAGTADADDDDADADEPNPSEARARRLRREQKAEEERAAELAHAASFWAQRPHNWADTGIGDSLANSAVPPPPLPDDDDDDGTDASAGARTAKAAPAASAAAAAASCDASAEEATPHADDPPADAAAPADAAVASASAAAAATSTGEIAVELAETRAAPVRAVPAVAAPRKSGIELAMAGGSLSEAAGGIYRHESVIARARRRIDEAGGMDAVGYDLKPKKKSRARVDPSGAAGSRDGTSTRALREDEDGAEFDDSDDDGGGGSATPGMPKADLAQALARNPRIVGYDEEGAEIAAMETAARIEWRAKQPLGTNDFFSGYCHEADMYLPIRAKYTKKHGRVVAKFDHYCCARTAWRTSSPSPAARAAPTPAAPCAPWPCGAWHSGRRGASPTGHAARIADALGNSVGELNHGRFYRFILAQLVSIWTGYWLLTHSYLSFHSSIGWTVANVPLLILNILTWSFGIPLTILLSMHTFHCCTASTTYEFIKLEKLEYLNGFYQFSFPFSEGLFQNIRHFCCPRGIQLWRRAPPEDEWPESFWRNRYYSCCG